MRVILSVALVTLFSSPAQAQMHNHQPYAGMATRSIKALSDQQIADLRDGRGMSLALAAELNGYPEPSHVLEHAEALKLTAAQQEKIQALTSHRRADDRRHDLLDLADTDRDSAIFGLVKGFRLPNEGRFDVRAPRPSASKPSNPTRPVPEPAE